MKRHDTLTLSHTSRTQPQNEAQQKHNNTNSTEHLLPVNVGMCVCFHLLCFRQECERKSKKKKENEKVIRWLVSDREMTQWLFNGFGSYMVF